MESGNMRLYRQETANFQTPAFIFLLLLLLLWHRQNEFVYGRLHWGTSCGLYRVRTVNACSNWTGWLPLTVKYYLHAWCARYLLYVRGFSHIFEIQMLSACQSVSQSGQCGRAVGSDTWWKNGFLPHILQRKPRNEQTLSGITHGMGDHVVQGNRKQYSWRKHGRIGKSCWIPQRNREHGPYMLLPYY